jgi:hypothetical protein
VPVTLAQAQVNVQNAISYQVIDNLRRYSWLMDQITFDDSVNPGTGGGTLTYGYTRLLTAAAAGFRAYNTEFIPGQATRSRTTVDLKPLGGAFTLDRDLASLGDAATNEITFQLQQLLTSIKIRFEQEVILGDISVDATGFDGLSKALTGTVTEKTAGYIAGSADWTAATIAGNIATANTRLDELDDLLSLVVPSHTGSGDQGMPGAVPPGTRAIMGNTKAVARIRSMARTASLYTSDKDSLGRQIEQYNGWNLVDIGDRYDGSAPIIPIGTAGAGLTDIYAVTFGLDSFHGVSKLGSDLVRTWMPDFTTAGAVKSGEAQMGPIAMCLKNTKSAAVLRSVKVS